MQIGMGGMTKTDLATSEETNWSPHCSLAEATTHTNSESIQEFPDPVGGEPANDAQTWSQPVITARSLKSASSMMVKVLQPT